jgi:hypothetical protein
MWSVVQVFNREGQLLYYFGRMGTAAGAFQLPTGLRIDAQDRIYVVDSFNKRVQVYHYYAAKQAAAAAGAANQGQQPAEARPQ